MCLGRIDFCAENSRYGASSALWCLRDTGRVLTSLDVMEDLFYRCQCRQINDVTKNKKPKTNNRTPIQTFGHLHNFNNLTQTTESAPVVLSY